MPNSFQTSFPHSVSWVNTWYSWFSTAKEQSYTGRGFMSAPLPCCTTHSLSSAPPSPQNDTGPNPDEDYICAPISDSL